MDKRHPEQTLTTWIHEVTQRAGVSAPEGEGFSSHSPRRGRVAEMMQQNWHPAGIYAALNWGENRGGALTATYFFPRLCLSKASWRYVVRPAAEAYE